MIKILAGVAAVGIFAMIGCDQELPQVDDPHNIVVKGNAMSQQDFLDKYCAGKVADMTCIKVTDAMKKDFSTKGHLPHRPN